MEEERYPMGNDQPAQIDCRDESCKFHINAECTNIAPAITMIPKEGYSGTGSWTCWSYIDKDAK